MKLFVCLLAGCLYAAGAFAAENVYVVDGDSLEMGEVRIRLEGIDAPEYYQDCRYPNNKKYACGLEARQYLQSLVDQGKVTCIERDLDRYNRSLCTCYVTNKIGEKTNLNEAMVRAGWAVVYKNKHSDYSAAEAEAEREKRGIWQGKFMKPQLYRILNK
ncbi:MAG: thermonuclease family protein [Alphaproteobacteria bacterium]|jgi:endonuclease YncB( thermonuclease family)